MDPEALRQLAWIGRVSESLDALRLDHWLFGGWGVDFWAGRRTRAHDDIDFAVWQRDRAAIHRALTDSGWRHTPFAGEVEGTRYRSDGVLLELTFLVPGEAGEVMIAMLPAPVVWATHPFGDDRCTLEGVTCRVVPLERLLADKSRPRSEPDDAAKDVADHAALSEVPLDVLLDRSSAKRDRSAGY